MGCTAAGECSHSAKQIREGAADGAERGQALCHLPQRLPHGASTPISDPSLFCPSESPLVCKHCNNMMALVTIIYQPYGCSFGNF